MCSTISTPGVYTLTSNVTPILTDSTTCFTVSAPNVTIDCNGYSIIGNNSQDSNGVYSDQQNTVVRNCNIRGFWRGIQFVGVTGGSVINTRADSTSCQISSCAGINFKMGSNNKIISSTGIANNHAIWLVNTRNSTISNSVGIANLTAIMVDYGTNVSINNSTGTSNSAFGIDFHAGSNNTIANSTATSGTGYAMMFDSSSNNTIFRNRISSGNTEVYLTPTSSGNLFYWNNFTGTLNPTYYIQDMNGSNLLNSTVNGSGEGNIYANVISGAVRVDGTYFSSGFPLYIGDSNSGYPYGTGTSQNKTVGASIDYAPLTLNKPTAPDCDCGVLSVPNYVCNVTRNLTSLGTCFTVQARNVTILCNGHSITGNGVGRGIFSNRQIETNVKDCNITNFFAGVEFNGASSGTINNTRAYSYVQNSRGIYLYDSSHNTITYSDAYSSSGYGVYLESSYQNIVDNVRGSVDGMGHGICMSDGDSNIISNSFGFSPSSYGIHVLHGYDNILSNSTGASNSSYGIYLTTSDGNLINNSNGISNSSTGIYVVKGSRNRIDNSNGTSTSEAGILILGGYSDEITNSNGISDSSTGIYIGEGGSNAITNSNGISNSSTGIYIFKSGPNIISNSTFIGWTSIYINSRYGERNYNVFVNNTLISSSNNNTSVLLKIDFSRSNTFYWNNFTATSGYYIQDGTAGNNFFNTTTPNGTNEGNIYANVMDSNISVFGTITSTGFQLLYIGDNGAGVPYSQTNSGNKIIGAAVDYAPLTPFVGTKSLLVNNSTGINQSLNTSIFNRTRLNISAIASKNITLALNITKSKKAPSSALNISGTKIIPCAPIADIVCNDYTAVHEYKDKNGCKHVCKATEAPSTAATATTISTISTGITQTKPTNQSTQPNATEKPLSIAPAIVINNSAAVVTKPTTSSVPQASTGKTSEIATQTATTASKPATATKTSTVSTATKTAETPVSTSAIPAKPSASTISTATQAKTVAAITPTETEATAAKP
ncbi:MAG: right-handed parallel beta-helix repeat-containing protein [Candidatus Micrarchaeota archaeon]|nr:right-handed parallel beta-helix repeat-containing protein [Candidatus Micrarchaeota archaeon]